MIFWAIWCGLLGKVLVRNNIAVKIWTRRPLEVSFYSQHNSVFKFRHCKLGKTENYILIRNMKLWEFRTWRILKTRAFWNIAPFSLVSRRLNLHTRRRENVKSHIVGYWLLVTFMRCYRTKRPMHCGYLINFALSSNHSSLIHQSSLANSSRDN
jgi:hypothetical protein